MSKWIAEFELEDGDSMPEHMDLNFMGVRLDFHCKPVSDCIPIPEDATNGDVIKAVFPNIEREDNYGDADFYLLNGKSAYTPKLIAFKSWWNAKYKGVK